MACSWGNNHEYFHYLTILKSESSLTNLQYCRPINLLNLGNISWKHRKWKFFLDNFLTEVNSSSIFCRNNPEGCSSAKFFLLLLSSARIGGTATYDKFYFYITYLSVSSPTITLPCLSVSSKLDWCDSGMQKCQLKNCWCCCSCQCCYWRGTYYWQIGREAEVWSKYQRWTFCRFFLVKFGSDMEHRVWSRF